MESGSQKLLDRCSEIGNNWGKERMTRFKICGIALLVLGAALTCVAQKKSDKSVTVVLKHGNQKILNIADGTRIEFKDSNMVVIRAGGQESIPVADIVRMEFSSSSVKSLPLSRKHFIGKWEVGEGVGTRTFEVTLDADGQAHKTIGAGHGTWVLVDNEARINWDDGWRDVIRKVGDKHEKFALEPGKSLTDEPSNVTNARSLNTEPM